MIDENFSTVDMACLLAEKLFDGLVFSEFT
jgi:hypothetical protein